SRRRHTRFSRDWSSDVCSSDLPGTAGRTAAGGAGRLACLPAQAPGPVHGGHPGLLAGRADGCGSDPPAGYTGQFRCAAAGGHPGAGQQCGGVRVAPSSVPGGQRMREHWKQALLEDLRRHGIVDDAAAAGVLQQGPAPWFVYLFAGLAAWLAASMLIISSAVMLAQDNALVAVLNGGVLLGLAVWLLRQPGIFLAQMGVALSLAGQGMLVYAASEIGFPGL